MIIDSHVHIGNSTWGDFTSEYLLELTKNVDLVICSNLEGIDSDLFKDEFSANTKMFEISNTYKKIKPLLVCQPNLAKDNSIIRHFLENYKDFIGLKFHPESMKLPANNTKYDTYLKLAEEFKKPCLYHAGHIKSKYSSPKLIYEKAKQFPTVPIILGHLSTGPKESHLEAIKILLDSIENNLATLYVDTSWIDFASERLNETYSDTIMLIKALRNTRKGDYTNRILWASDCPVGKFNQTKNNYDYNMECFKKAILNEFNDEDLLNNLLYKNAKTLYKL